MQIAKHREVYAPIHYVYPSLGNRKFLGFDLLTNSTDVVSMTNVIASNNIVTSAPINLIQDDHRNLGVLFFSSVHGVGEQAESAFTNNNNKPSLLGFVVAVMQFELNIFSRHWRISLVEQQPWKMQQKSWQAWGMLLGAT